MLLRQEATVEAGDAAAHYYVIKMGDRGLLLNFRLKDTIYKEGVNIDVNKKG